MTDAVLIDLAVKVDPGIEVVFIDTGYHFPETLETVEEVRRHYGLNLRMMTVARQDEELWKADPENCCSAVKVGQLDRALAGKAGVDERPAPRRGRPPGRRRRSWPATSGAWSRSTRIATWTDLDVQGYIADHDVAGEPAASHQGYPSIGCMPCTSPVADGEDPRAGRWRGSDKTECGLHMA